MTVESLAIIGADAVHRPPFSEKGDQVIIGIVDDGIDVTHSAFLDETGNTRILMLWDQTTDVSPPPELVPFGRLFTQEQINTFISNNSVPSGLSAAHGTGVASIAAGKPAPPIASAEPKFHGGVAPESKIIVVKPKITIDQNDEMALGSSFSHIQAIDFIRRIAQDQQLPFVINLSFGTNVGAHDGSTMLENYLETLMGNGTIPGRAVVKSAGNEHDKSASAALDLSPNRQSFLTWNSRTVSREKDVIELWFKSADVFTFRLHQPESPASGVSELISLDNPEVSGQLENNNSYQITYQRFTAQNGDSNLSIIIEPGASDEIQGGDWKLEINAGDELPSGGHIHAWVERDDRRRAIRFKGHDNSAPSLTIPGTGRSVISVAATLKNADTISVWPPSSRGPTRDGRAKPDLAAPGSKIAVAHAHSRHGIVLKSGTSFAAPHVSGAIGLIFSHCKKKNLPQFNSIQLQTLLTQFSSGFDGEWSKDIGYGSLDIESVFRQIFT